MNPTLKTSIMCVMLMVSTFTHADEYADLRKSTNNMSKAEAQKVEAGVAPIAVRVVSSAAKKIVRHMAKEATKETIKSVKNRNHTPPPPNYTGKGSTINSR